MDTRLLPPAEQFAGWASHSPNTRLSAAGENGFLARGEVWNLGPVLVAETVLDPFVSDRDQGLVNLAPADHVQLVVVHDGAVRFEAAGVDEVCVAPDLFVRDYARPSRATATRIHSTTVYFTRAYLEEVVGPLDVHGVLPFSPETVVFTAALVAMVANLSTASASSAPLYARTLRDLAAAALLGGSAPPRTANDRDRLAAAKAHIASQPPGTVTVAGVARHLGVSRSVLFDLFRRDGGIMTFDRVRRLRALYRDLADVNQTGSVATLGARHGFLDKAGLARTFRTTFGRSPREVRQSIGSRIDAGPGTPAEGVRRMVDSLA